jgi:hypothetical protein
MILVPTSPHRVDGLSPTNTPSCGNSMSSPPRIFCSLRRAKAAENSRSDLGHERKVEAEATENEQSNVHKHDREIMNNIMKEI